MCLGIVELIMRVTTALILPMLIGEQGIYFAKVIGWSGAAIWLYVSYVVLRGKLLKE